MENERFVKKETNNKIKTCCGKITFCKHITMFKYLVFECLVFVYLVFKYLVALDILLLSIHDTLHVPELSLAICPGARREPLKNVEGFVFC